MEPPHGYLFILAAILDFGIFLFYRKVMNTIKSEEDKKHSPFKYRMNIT